MKILQSGHNVYHIDMVKNPQGLVKEMLKKFGPDFKHMLDLPGVHSIKYLVNRKKLELIASDVGCKKVSGVR